MASEELNKMFQELEADIQHVDGIADSFYVNLAVDFLKQHGFRETAQEYAEGVLLYGEESDENAENSYDSTLKIFGEKLSKVKEGNFIYFKAPSSKKRPIEQDMDMREKESEAFFTKFGSKIPGFTTYDAATRVNIMSSAELTTELQNFIQGRATSSAKAVIIFSGHGSRSGKMCFEKGDGWKFDDVKDFIIAEKNEAHKKQEGPDRLPLPQLIHPIFLQCYGYKFQETDDEHVAPMAVTAPDHETSVTRHRQDKKTGLFNSAKCAEVEECVERMEEPNTEIESDNQ